MNATLKLELGGPGLIFIAVTSLPCGPVKVSLGVGECSRSLIVGEMISGIPRSGRVCEIHPLRSKTKLI